MVQTYSIEFKEEACKRVWSDISATQAARELGINVNTLYTWMSRFKEHPAEPFVGICIYRPFIGNEKARDKAVEKGRDSLSYYHYYKLDKKYDELIEQDRKGNPLLETIKKNVGGRKKGNFLPW